MDSVLGVGSVAVERDVITTENIWQSIWTKVLPLFNGEGLKGSMEDLNDLVTYEFVLFVCLFVCFVFVF